MCEDVLGEHRVGKQHQRRAEENDEAQRLQSNAIELAMLLTVPAAAALFVSGSAFTRVFFAGGAFSVEDALITGTPMC